jgi:hypothetical protein
MGGLKSFPARDVISLLLLASGGASADNLTPYKRPVTGIFPENFKHERNGNTSDDGQCAD